LSESSFTFVDKSLGKFKNSEDVQDALIEDYFRYDDLSRMEADDILMNISEIESPNYEYVELDLLNRLTSLGTFPCDCRNV
jgi:hypothetical protein